MTDLIQAPDLELRDEDQLAAEAIARVSGGLTLARVDQGIETWRRLRALIEAGGIVPICPELTNANPSSSHTVVLEAIAWLEAFIARRINRLPERDSIEFHRLFKIELREATPATTTLEFTVDPPIGVDVTIPAGSQVSTEDGAYIFATNEELVVEFGAATGQVQARRTVAGETALAPNVLVKLLDPIAWVESVTNPSAVSSGANTERIEEALQRARNYQRRGERLVSAQDLEDAVLEELLRGNGIVRAFPFVRAGDFTEHLPGHTTLVVMTKLGDPVSAEVKRAINSVLDQVVGSQFVYVLDPIYIEFNVLVDVRLRTGVTATAVRAAIETNLRAFYAANRENFGRPILRSEVIAVVEGTTGVDRIVAQASGAILASPATDTRLDPWQLPKLLMVTVNVV